MKTLTTVALVFSILLASLPPASLAATSVEKKIALDRRFGELAAENLRLAPSRDIPGTAANEDITDIPMPAMPLSGQFDARIELRSLAAGPDISVPNPGIPRLVETRPDPAVRATAMRQKSEAVGGADVRLRSALRDPFERADDGANERYLYVLPRPLVSETRFEWYHKAYYYGKKFIGKGALWLGVWWWAGTVAPLALSVLDIAPLAMVLPAQSGRALQAHYHWDRFKRLRKLSRLDGVLGMSILVSKDVRMSGLLAAEQSARAYVFLETDRPLPEAIPDRLLLDPPSSAYIRARRWASRFGLMGRSSFNPVRSVFNWLGRRDKDDFGAPKLVEDPSRTAIELRLELAGRIEEELPVWRTTLDQVLAQTPIPPEVSEVWKARAERFEREAAQERSLARPEDGFAVRMLKRILPRALVAFYLRHWSYAILADISVRGRLVQPFMEGGETELSGVLAGKPLTRLLGMTHWDRLALTEWEFFNRFVRRFLPERFRVRYAQNIPVSRIRVQDRMTRPGLFSQTLQRMAGRLIVRNASTFEHVLWYAGWLAGAAIGGLPFFIPKTYAWPIYFAIAAATVLTFLLMPTIRRFAARITHRD